MSDHVDMGCEASFVIRVEGAFIRVDGVGGGISGFFATFGVRAGSLSEAKVRLKELVANRMEIGNVKRNDGIFSTYFVVDELWVVGDSFDASEFAGFTFYRMSAVDCVRGIIRGLVLKFRKDESIFVLP